MDYLLVFVLVTLNLIFAKLTGDQSWSLQVILVNYGIGFLLYHYLVFVENRITRNDSDVDQKKHFVKVIISIAIFAIATAVFNGILNIPYLMNEMGINDVGTLASLSGNSVISVFANNFLISIINVVLFLVLKNIVFKIALKVKTSKLQ